jgi:hypothetical protein
LVRVSRFGTLERLCKEMAGSQPRQEESSMKMYQMLFVVPVCALAMACGGEATPEPAAPEGAAAEEAAPAEEAMPAEEAPAEAEAAPAEGEAPAAE